MKKYILIVCGLLASTPLVLAQDQLGIKVSPGLSYNRIHSNPDTTDFTGDGLGLNLKLGLIYDRCIKDNYYLHTGLLFATKRFSLQSSEFNLQEAHSLQYIQVPLLFKLYTSDIALDTRIYIELGPVGAIKIHERVSKLSTESPFIQKFRAWETSGLLGIGIEYQLSLFTSIFAGLSCQPGLSSILAKQNESVQAPLVEGYNDYITLEIGLKL